jgi:hypothetical protein
MVNISSEDFMTIKAAFIFIAPQAEASKHRSVVKTPSMELTVVGVSTYEAAIEVAKELVAAGTVALELCAGFGIEGVAAIKSAVGGKIPVGVVRFDYHPAFGFKSGDEVFAAKTVSVK